MQNEESLRLPVFGEAEEGGVEAVVGHFLPGLVAGPYGTNGRAGSDAVEADEEAGAVLAVLAVDEGARGDLGEGGVDVGGGWSGDELLEGVDGMVVEGHAEGDGLAVTGFFDLVELDDVRDAGLAEPLPAGQGGLAASVNGGLVNKGEVRDLVGEGSGGKGGSRKQK